MTEHLQYLPMIIKSRARKSLVQDRIDSSFIAARGVGGIEMPCIGFSIGEYRVIIPVDVWEKLCTDITDLRKDMI